MTPADPAEVALTQSITLKCQADGFPNPSYSWKFNGASNGITQNTLTITNADVKDAGNYTCLARNVYGNKETTKVVYVRCEFIIFVLMNVRMYRFMLVSIYITCIHI